MSDTIDRQATLRAMDTWDKFGCDPDGKLVRYDDDKHYISYVHYDDMVHAVKHMPAAQPERKTGKWIKVDMHAKCTACGQECYVPTCMGEPMYTYCPNCGARMEGENETD